MGQRFELTDAVVFNVQAPMIGEPDGVGWEDLIGVTGDEESERPPGLGLSELAATKGGLGNLSSQTTTRAGSSRPSQEVNPSSAQAVTWRWWWPMDSVQHKNQAQQGFRV